MRRKVLLFLLVVFLSLSTLSASIFRPRFALVLSGGGAKGIAHIPIMKELDKRGIVPDMIIGTSMGAVLGSFYAAGYSGEELEKIVLETDLMSYFLHLYAIRGADVITSPFQAYDTNILTVEFGSSGFGASNGLIDDQYINGLLRKYLSKVLSVDDFDDLPIPFRAIGSDITNNRKVVFASGSLFDAVRASMAIPVVFAPVRLEDGSYIVDGGLEDNLPTDIARELGADIVLAVDVNDARHRYGEHKNDMTTLSGTFSQLSDYLTEPASAENYDEADWVIVPDTTGYSALGFGDTAEILEKGEEAVQANMAVFDELEKKLERWLPMERVSYSELSSPEIERVVTDEIIPLSAVPVLRSYEGRTMDFDTIDEFEMLLDDIRRHEGLKSVTYEIRNGVISVEGERYPSLSGSVYIGLSGGIGIRYDGSEDSAPYFAYTPVFTISGKLTLLPRLDLTYGIVVGDGIKLEAGVSYPFLSSAFLYGNLGIKYGQLSYLSIPGTGEYVYSNDVSLSLQGGIGWIPLRDFRLDAIAGFDYTYLSNRNFSNNHFAYPYIGLGLVYDIYDGSNASDNGVEASMTVEFGGDFPSSTLSYAFKADLFGAFGPTDIFKFIIDAETASIRRPPELAKAYVSTAMGKKAADYAHVMGGIMLPLPYSIFLDAGVFFELYGGYYDEVAAASGRNLVPYTEFFEGEHSMDIGGYIAAGVATSFGQITAGLYISATPRISFMVGIE